MNNEKTIKQLADELGVSKQTIQKIIEKISDENKPSKLGNRYLLSLENQNYIRNKLGIKVDDFSDISDKLSDKSNISDNDSSNLDKKSDNLDINEYLNVVLAQLDTKDKQIDKLQKLLDQQQILTLQANKKIEELELKSNERETQKKENDFSFTKDGEEKEEQKVEEPSGDKNVRGTTDKKSFWARWFKK